MKYLLIGFLTLGSFSTFAYDKCHNQAQKTAKLVESLSQSAPLKSLTTSTMLVNQVRCGGEYLNTYQVDVFDSRNDGLSRYEVSIYSSECSIVKKIELITQS